MTAEPLRRAASLCLAAAVLTAALPALIAAASLEELASRSRSRDDITATQVHTLRIVCASRVITAAKKGQRTVQAIRQRITLQQPRFRIDYLQQGEPAEDGSPGADIIAESLVFDGARLWRVLPGRPPVEQPRDETLPFFVRLPWWQSLTTAARLAGAEQVSGRACQIVHDPEAAVPSFSRLWLDQDAVLIQAESRVRGKTLCYSFSDFRTLPPLRSLPFRIDIRENRIPSTVVLVEFVEKNPELPADFFDAAPGGTAP